VTTTDHGGTPGNQSQDLTPGRGTDGAVRCVFSSLEEIRVGTGTTTRKHLSKLFWFVEELGDDRFSVRRINAHHVPSGDEQIITLATLKELYSLEVEFFEGNTVPAMELLNDYLDEGEDLREQGRHYSAQDSFNRALGMEEKNVRALFNLGLIYMELHDMSKARDIMLELLKIRSTFAGKDHHLFNEFGISLRKNGLFEDAAAYYAKALEFVTDDENLYYNLARVNYERGHWDECVEAIRMSRELNPHLGPTMRLGELILELSKNPSLREQYKKPPIPRETATGLLGIMQAEFPYASVRSNVQSPESGRARTGMAIGRDELKFDI
jgi:tetratricopeptide (TPR) repeat protein